VVVTSKMILLKKTFKMIYRLIHVIV